MVAELRLLYLGTGRWRRNFLDDRPTGSGRGEPLARPWLTRVRAAADRLSRGAAQVVKVGNRLGAEPREDRDTALPFLQMAAHRARGKPLSPLRRPSGTPLGGCDLSDCGDRKAVKPVKPVFGSPVPHRLRNFRRLRIGAAMQEMVDQVVSHPHEVLDGRLDGGPALLVHLQAEPELHRDLVGRHFRISG